MKIEEREPEPKPNSDITGEFLLGLLLISFSIFVIVEAVRMPQRGMEGFLMSPGFVPLLTGSVLLFLSIIFTLSTIQKDEFRQLKNWLRESVVDYESRKCLVIMALMGFYVIGLLDRIPFVVATLIFHILIFSYLKVGDPKKIVFYALFAAFFIGFFLPWLFEMPLP